MVSNPKKPQVVLFGDVLSDALMPRLYAAADCYCLISRGEGFGLPFAEAAACNVPIIASRYSGQTDFLTDDNSYLVDVDGFRSAETTLAWISYFYEDAEFPIFGQKAVEQTRQHMRRVFEKKEEAQQKSNKLHEKIVTEYNWKACVDQMYAKLKNTYDNL
jgi:glycosyltransferase involved in cell wall biosynthesis